MGLDPEVLRAVPKVALHDHLDGGLRASTVLEIAGEIGHELPAADPDSLADWFADAADSGSLVRYLETFEHTIAVMQTYDQLRRVAREFVEDQAADGVVYAEARWAPEQHRRAGLTMAQAVEAVREGLAEGMAGCAALGRTIVARQILTAMRHAVPTSEVAELAVRYRDDSVCSSLRSSGPSSPSEELEQARFFSRAVPRFARQDPQSALEDEQARLPLASIGSASVYSSLRSSGPSSPSEELEQARFFSRAASVCGFDIAGAEDGYPPSRFGPSFEYLRRNNMEYTIHAGEAFGLPSIWEALQLCGASRLGHGVRLVDDISRGPDGWVLGEVAGYVRDRRIPLELCPSSNLQTGVCATIGEHPFGLLAALRFRVTVNCDNRLMSRTTLSREFGLLADAFGYSLADVRRFTVNAAKSAFYPYDKRRELINQVILPGFAAHGVAPGDEGGR